MSSEFNLDFTTGVTLYCLVFNRTGKVWYLVGQVFETWGTGARTAADYDIALAEIGSGSGKYTGDIDANVPAGQYTIQARQRMGASPADSDPLVGYSPQELIWTGLQEISVLDALVGPGDYEVTLTIRTTGGTALAGASVWLSDNNDRSNACTVPRMTDDAGQVKIWLHYSIVYYIHCHKTNYSFNDASFTPSAGQVTFVKDVAYSIAPEGAAADYTDSFLVRAVAAVRDYVDEPVVNAKYTDTDIIEKLEQAYVLVLGEKNRNAQTPIVGKTTLTIAHGTNEYLLPYGVPVYAIYYKDEYGCKAFYDSRSRYNQYGRNVWMEGNVLKLQYSGVIPGGTIITVEWLPNGTARLHAGTCSVDATGKIVTLAASPYVGVLDTHVNAYAGCVLRVLKVTGTGATGNYVQERVISGYDNTTRAATLEVALNPIPAAGVGGYIFCEVAPAIPIGLDQVIASYAAYSIVKMEGNARRADSVLDIYRDQVRNVRLDAFYSNLQQASQMRSDNYRNRRYRQI